MDLRETAELLALAALTDGRKVDEAVLVWWHELLADTTFADAREVLKKHYQGSTEYLMPVHIVQGVQEIQRERLRAYGTLVLTEVWPDFDEEGPGYSAKMRELAALVSSGRVRRGGGGRPELTA